MKLFLWTTYALVVVIINIISNYIKAKIENKWHKNCFLFLEKCCTVFAKTEIANLVVINKIHTIIVIKSKKNAYLGCSKKSNLRSTNSGSLTREISRLAVRSSAVRMNMPCIAVLPGVRRASYLYSTCKTHFYKQCGSKIK